MRPSPARGFFLPRGRRRRAPLCPPAHRKGWKTMTLPSLFLLALGLSMDAFAVSVSNSLCFAGLRRRDGALTSAAFGIFQGLMPILGFFAGRLFAEAVSAVDHWIAFVLLGFIGGKMLAEALRELRAGEAGACAPQKRFS